MGTTEASSGGARRRTGAGGWPGRYAVAVGVIGVAFALKMELADYFGPPYILFYPAIMVVAMLAGLGPGLLATALASTMAIGWVLPAEAPGRGLTTGRLVSLLVFSAMGVFMSAMAERYRQTRDRLAQAKFQRALRDSGAESLEAVRKVAAEARRAAVRQAYAVTLSDTLRPLGDPAEIQRQASRLLGEALGASRIHYAEVVEGGAYGLVRSDYTDRLPSVAGRHRFDDYGPVVMNEFRAGRTLVVPDVANDPRLTPAERAATAGLQVASYVILPLFKEARPVAVLVAHQSAPRTWTPSELELMTETAERTWAAVERAHAEAALRENVARYQAIFEQAAAGVALVEAASGRFLQVNARLAALLGYSREELEGLSWADLTLPEDLEQGRASVRRMLATGTPFHAEKRYRRKDGEVLWASLTVSPVHVPGEPITRQISVVTDITGRRAAEAERAKLEAQLQQARKMESIGRLAGGIAHDFNNMLGVILGHADVALERAEEPLRTDLNEIRGAALRSADLTRQLLAFARKQTISPQVLDLNATMAGMLKMLQRLLGEQISLAWKPASGLWPVRMDPSQVDQILANLSVNARDAIAGVGRLTIETDNVTLDEAACRTRAEATPGDWVRLTVSDDGGGMAPETLAHLFEPFFTTKAQGKGTGLGLATIYGIVKQNGGFISVYSEPGVGTAFAIHLPRHQGAPALPVAASGARPPARGHGTVLLVEDEAAILGVARRMLEGQGYRVLAASSPEEGLRLAGEHPGQVDLLLTDVVMPRMNGRELALSLKEQHPEARWLFMSGYTADVIASQGVLADGAHFIQKPFTGEALAAAVRTALDGQG